MKNIFKTIILSILMTLLLGISAFADEKNIDIPINKDYNSAKFILTFDDYNNEQIYIISPDGKNKYTGTLVSDNVIEITVNDEVKSGTWTAHIENETLTDTNGNSIENPIGKVKIEVNGSNKQIKDVTKDITVSTDIMGLKLYLKDDSFVAEWADTSCGDVNITVVNGENLQKLGSETVSSRYYELPLENDTKELIVTIVPSRSSSIEGAETKYTIPVDNHPNATIEYEDVEITNKDTINAHIVLNESYALKIYNNGNYVESIEKKDKGEYDYELNTEVGDNNFLIYIVDDKGNMRSTAGYVFKDVIAPNLKLKNVYADIQTYDPSITIEGEVTDFDYFTINDKEVKVEGDWTFSYVYELKDGYNEIVIKAKDIAGNETFYTATVTKLVKKEKEIPTTTIIIIALIVILAGLLIVAKIKRPDLFQKKEKSVKAKTVKEKEISETIETKAEKNSKNKGKEILNDLLNLFLFPIIIFIIFKFIIGITVVQSGSMEPTLMTGNTVFYNYLAYEFNDIERGDIVLFWSDEYQKYFGKRVIGLPNDEICFSNGNLIINGLYVDESEYIPEDVETNCEKRFKVPEDTYFLLGDNRENSLDARFWKNPYISKEKILGKYLGQIDFSFQFDILAKFK